MRPSRWLAIHRRCWTKWCSCGLSIRTPKGYLRMPSSLTTRLRRLEAQAHGEPHGQGIAALLEYARRHNITRDHVPLAALTDAALDAKIADLTAQVVAGARGYPRLLLEALVLYRQPA